MWVGRAPICRGLTQGDFSRGRYGVFLLSLPPGWALGVGTWLGMIQGLTSLLSSCSVPRRESRSWVSFCSSSSWA